MRATRRVLLLLLATLIWTLFLAVPGVSWADTPDTTLDVAARQLGDKIVAALPPREAVFVDLRNLSSLSGLEVVAVRRALESELQSRGLQLVSESAPHVEVRLTLSETPDGLLWVAEVPHAEARQVEMISLPKPRGSDTRPRAPELLLEKKLIWEQEEQILDLALLDAPGAKDQRMVVLEPTRIALYGRKGDGWELRQGFPVGSADPAPRDLRGQIQYGKKKKDPGGEEVWAVLPRMSCVLKLSETSKAREIDCNRSNAPEWVLFAGAGIAYALLDFADSRNFYTGEIRGEGGTVAKIAPFFSGAVIQEKASGDDLWILAHLDGRVQLYNNERRLLATFSGWGSELASIESGCGVGWQLLVTRSGDWTETDAITAYEIVDWQALAVGWPIEFPGPVMSLESRANNGAIAVVRNLKTGRYEAYQLSISCGR